MVMDVPSETRKGGWYRHVMRRLDGDEMCQVMVIDMPRRKERRLKWLKWYRHVMRRLMVMDVPSD